MLTPSLTDTDMSRLEEALLSIEKKESVNDAPISFFMPKKACSIREAIMSPQERVDVKNANGRVLAQASVGCPPAVPIIMSGEIVDENAIKCFSYYGIENCLVLK